ncbi:MAG: RebB family R body protein [Rhizomicrobium sp.]
MNDPQDTPTTGDDGTPHAARSARAALDDSVANLSKLYADLAGKEGVSPQVTDAITQALLLILGSGPAIAAFDQLMAAQAANGLMYHNAVANQQKTNMLGMAMTAKCVRYMMDPHAGDLAIDTILEDEGVPH